MLKAFKIEDDDIYGGYDFSKESPQEKAKNDFIDSLEIAFNGDTERLLNIIHKYPSLIPIYSNKKIKFTNNSVKLKQLCDGIGQENFFFTI